jgi:hypothetical protein
MRQCTATPATRVPRSIYLAGVLSFRLSKFVRQIAETFPCAWLASAAWYKRWL